MHPARMLVAAGVAGPLHVTSSCGPGPAAQGRGRVAWGKRQKRLRCAGLVGRHTRSHLGARARSNHPGQHSEYPANTGAGVAGTATAGAPVASGPKPRPELYHHNTGPSCAPHGTRRPAGPLAPVSARPAVCVAGVTAARHAPVLVGPTPPGSAPTPRHQSHAAGLYSLARPPWRCWHRDTGAPLLARRLRSR